VYLAYIGLLELLSMLKRNRLPKQNGVGGIINEASKGIYILFKII
jgi:hypothetical protein